MTDAVKTLLLIITILLLFPGCSSEESLHVKAMPHHETIIIGGSQSVIPIIRILAGAFEAEHPGMKINFGPEGHTGSGIKGVYNGAYSLGALSRDLRPKEKSYGLSEYWFARDALIFATHASVEIRNLTADQIRDIYTGRITNWKNLGGPDRDIRVLDRYDGSSPRVLLYKTSFFTGDITGKAVTLESPNDMNVALLNTPDSIGYTSLASILKDQLEVNVISLDGIMPSPGEVSSGRYALARPQGLIARANVSGLTKDFLDFIFSEQGQSILRQHGYVPLK